MHGAQHHCRLQSTDRKTEVAERKTLALSASAGFSGFVLSSDQHLMAD